MVAGLSREQRAASKRRFDGPGQRGTRMMHKVSEVLPEPYETWHQVYPERRTCFLVLGSVRRVSTLWAVDRLLRSPHPPKDRGPQSQGDQIVETGIDPIESLHMA